MNIVLFISAAILAFSLPAYVRSETPSAKITRFILRIAGIAVFVAGLILTII